MDRYKYFMFNQKNVLVLGVLQVACAALCLICGFMDAVFRKDTPLSTTRTPVWGAMVSVMVAAAVLSCVATVFVLGYACLTLTYGEEDKEVFHHHDSPEVTFVLHRMVKGANATILLSCFVSLLISSLIAYAGCCSLPRCGCYDARTGLETLVPQCDPGDAEMVCTWQVCHAVLLTAGSDDRLFNSPFQSPPDCGKTQEDLGASSKLPPYSRLS
ncbi:uncharacterized protein zgc:113425 isoform X3 [Nerophis ophidion]|uniref:uncharacterized protein zgc:113425 isoform X3 n=1 Tax=Nerophis ophidion TaxID=159077 RepID=UPI002ADF11C2|nr:uncharacterized protein zgc:113425 isoform X3 [Nerophis ophidion]